MKVASILISLFMLIVIINIGLLDYWVIQQIKNPPASPLPTPSEKVEATQIPQLTCTDACLNIIKEATASITKATQKPTPKTQTTKTTIVQTTPTPLKELFIAIGNGSTASTDWTNISDDQVLIDKGKYAHVKNMYFEARLSVPSSEGTAYARLYNLTDSQTVPNSDITTANPSPQFLTSAPITLEGTKTYTIQIKSSLGKDMKIENGRIRIVLN